MNKFKFKAAVANKSGAMEADTILKNGWNLKNHRSSGNQNLIGE